MRCWIKTKWDEFVSVFLGRFPIDGCEYYETYQNKDVQILKCIRCGKYSIAYENGEPGQPMK